MVAAVALLWPCCLCVGFLRAGRFFRRPRCASHFAQCVVRHIAALEQYITVLTSTKPYHFGWCLVRKTVTMSTNLGRIVFIKNTNKQ